MKKIFLLLVVMLFFVCGCSKHTEKDVIKDLENKVKKADGYKLSGELQVLNNDDVYNYDVEVSHKKDNYYRVSLTNKANDHTQVILKNDDGVYILTPSLNKSFKFQSDWPYSNSQIYLLSALCNDINGTKEVGFEEVDNGYNLITDVNYPNNKKLVRQTIELDKDLNIKNVKVTDIDGVIWMSMKFKDIDYSPTFKDDYFELDSIMSNYVIDDMATKEVMALDESIYPLVIPEGTKLVSEEKVQKDGGERIIMTFDGASPFLLVEETANVLEEFTVIPTYGEPYQLMDTLGVITTNSLSWTSNGVEYYLVSDVMEQEELIEVAQSISTLPTMK